MRRIPFWLWLNVLGLDAAIIAVLWQNAFASAFGITIEFPLRVGIFCVVWAVYMGDRFIDGLRLNITEHSAPRHLFAARHRSLFLILLTIAMAGAIYAALHASPKILMGALMVGVSTVIYFLWNHIARGTFTRKYFKEVAIAFIFMMGTILVPAIKGAAADFSFGAGSALFFGLCLANCAMISRIEREVDIARGEESYAIHFERHSKPGRWLAVGIGLGSVIFALAGLLPRDLALPLAMSSIGLFLTLSVERRFGPRFAVNWVDWSLMTPAILLVTKNFH